MNRLFLGVAAAAALVFIGAAAASADKLPPPPPGVTMAEWKKVFTPLPGHPAGIPADAVGQLGCIPTMGYHYAAPKNWPAGPIYGWYDGQVTFTEVMLPQSSFKAGKEWQEVLKP